MDVKAQRAEQTRNSIEQIVQGIVGWVQSPAYTPQWVTSADLYHELQIVLFGKVYADYSCPSPFWPCTARSLGRRLAQHKEHIQQWLETEGITMRWRLDTHRKALIYYFTKSRL
jgi:hypothetical protein